METKKWFFSKINISAIIVALLIILPEIQQLIDGTDFGTMNLVRWVSFVITILIIVFRTFATNTNIKTPIR